jgi:hypothetical protein
VVPVIGLGVFLGVLVKLGMRWRSARAASRDERERERVAAIVLYEEMSAAIGGLDLALREDGSKWLESMAQSTTLIEAWQEHGPALIGLGLERWYTLSDAVTAMEPAYELAAAKPQPHELRASLAERRRLLVDGAEILHERAAA